MRKRRILCLTVALGAILALTGCGEKFPELTEEQYNQTVEFAAGVLMKHSNNGQERLTYVSAEEINKQRDKEARLAKQQEVLEQAAQQTPTQPAQVQEPPVDTDASQQEEEYLTSDTPEVENPEGQEDNATEETTGAEEAAGSEGSDETGSSGLPDAITLSPEDSQEIMDSIFLSYQGYSVSNTYPESSKSYVVNADKGKRLLVLRFDLYNAAESTKEVDLLQLNAKFKIYLNGKDIGYSSVTFLPNDLTQFKGNIESKAHESVVVLTQIDEESSKKIENISLEVTLRGETQNVNLK